MMRQQNLAASMGSVARALLGEPNLRLSSRHELRFGNKGSLSVDLRKGTYFDHEAGRGGGVLDLVCRERKCSGREARSFLETLFETPPLAPTIRHDRAKPRDCRDAAARIWRDSVAVSGTIAEAYLRSRGLTLPLPGKAIRFHPRCPFGKDDRGRAEYRPAMICLMRSVTSGEALGIHRTALDPANGRKIGRKMLGPCEGAAVMLAPLAPGKGALGICEGVETGLAIVEAGHAPVWALGAAGKVARMPVIPGVRGLTTWVDHDAAGISAAETCEKRWQLAGVNVTRMMPSRPGWDFLDELLAFRAGRGRHVD